MVPEYSEGVVIAVAGEAPLRLSTLTTEATATSTAAFQDTGDTGNSDSVLWL
jgi:hypothetical protein